MSLALGLASQVIHSPPVDRPSHSPVLAGSVPAMSSRLRPPPATTSSRVERLVERAMTFAVEEYDDDDDDDCAVARLAWLAQDDHPALDGPATSASTTPTSTWPSVVERSGC
jgi:hypothetical protein